MMRPKCIVTFFKAFVHTRETRITHAATSHTHHNVRKIIRGNSVFFKETVLHFEIAGHAEIQSEQTILKEYGTFDK